MRNPRAFGFILTLATLTLFGSDAFAQKIRSYGDSAEAQYGTQTNTTAVDQASGNTGQTGGTQVTRVDTSTGGQAQQGAQTGADGQATTELEPSYVTVFNPGGAQAPLPVDLTPEKMYSGIIPGTRDEVSHLQKATNKGQDRSNNNRLTWVGFHAREDVTRVFFQTAREADYTLGEEGGAVTVTFNNTQVSAYNFRRFVDSSFFNRNVTRVEVAKVGRDTVVAKVFLRQYERPDVDRSGNYLYLDFSGAKMESSSTGASSASTDTE